MAAHLGGGGRCATARGPHRSETVHSPLPRFLVLYGVLFAGFGVASPFLPALLKQFGLGSAAIGAVLAAGTAIRLLTGPLGGRWADRSGRAPLVLALLLAASAAVALGYLSARGFALLLLVSVLHASVLAPLTPVADALTLGSSERRPGFPYGWVRGAGSASFIVGTLLSGQAVSRFGLGAFVWMNAALLAAAAGVAPFLPNRVAGRTEGPAPAATQRGSVAALLRTPAFPRLMVVASLILGSHAMHDGFSVIRWRSAGLSAGQVSVVWSMSVAAEVVVFVLLGQPILDRIGPARSLMVAAVAGIARWGISARTAFFPIIACSETLHGLSFALMHLACMRVIAAMVPSRLAATAQAFYATVAVGAASAAITLAAGPAYARFGPGAFWAMAALCAAALPVAAGLRVPDRHGHPDT